MKHIASKCKTRLEEIDVSTKYNKYPNGVNTHNSPIPPSIPKEKY